MDRRTNNRTVPTLQAATFRKVRDCGVIRITSSHPTIWEDACHLQGRGLVRIRISPTRLYADISLTEAGRAIAG